MSTTFLANLYNIIHITYIIIFNNSNHLIK